MMPAISTPILNTPKPDVRANGFPAAALYRLSVDQYHDMIRQGILKDGDPVELVEGVLVQEMTINPPHDFATQTLRDVLGPLAAPEPRYTPAAFAVSPSEHPLAPMFAYNQ